MSPKRKRQNKTADEVQALEAVLALGLPSVDAEPIVAIGEAISSE